MVLRGLVGCFGRFIGSQVNWIGLNCLHIARSLSGVPSYCHLYTNSIHSCVIYARIYCIYGVICLFYIVNGNPLSVCAFPLLQSPNLFLCTCTSSTTRMCLTTCHHTKKKCGTSLPFAHNSHTCRIHRHTTHSQSQSSLSLHTCTYADNIEHSHIYPVNNTVRRKTNDQCLVFVCLCK